MADPRIYQAYLGHPADASCGRSIARRLVSAAGAPAASISVWASLAPASVAGVAALLPNEILSADITLEPARLARLVGALQDESPAHNWFLVQRPSAFGPAFGLGTPHPSHHDESSATLSLDFGDDPVPEAIANGRFGRWLHELTVAGLLPESVPASLLMDRFAAVFPPRPTARAADGPGGPSPAFEVSGVRASVRGWRVMRGDRAWYWPSACQLAIGTKPVAALSLAAPLFAAGGPVEFHGYYSAAILGGTGLAARLARVGSSTFVLHTIDGDDTDVDDAMVDALIRVAGDDLVCVEWSCDWPDTVPGYNGVQLTLNGVGNLHGDDPEHVPGAAAVYVTVHPRSARSADALAARLSKVAGARLRPT